MNLAQFSELMSVAWFVVPTLLAILGWLTDSSKATFASYIVLILCSPFMAFDAWTSGHPILAIFYVLPSLLYVLLVAVMVAIVRDYLLQRCNAKGDK